MAPPPLPESTLVIAPNAGAKKKRRPVFRPGQRAAKAASNKKSNLENNKGRLDEGKGTSSASKKDSSLDKQKRQEDVSENTAPDNSQATAEPNNPLEKTAPSVKEAEGVTGLDKRKVTSNNNNTAKAAAPRLASALKKHKPIPTNSRTSSRTRGSAIRTKLASPIKTKVTTPKASAVKPNDASTIKPKTKEASPIRAGRKRKPTGLVIGMSSRASTRAKTRNEKRQEDVETPAVEGVAVLTTSKRATNKASNPSAVVPAGRLPPLLPANLPAAKEGEVSLSLFCSKFKSKPHHPPEQPKKKQKQANKNKEKEKEQEPPEEAVPVVQIINGEIVLQESSMVVEERGGSSLRRAGDDFIDDTYTHVVEEDADLTIVNADYTSFTNRTKPSLWSSDETKLFYEALRQVGTDFMLMSEFFKSKNRKQLKRKYQKELTNNPKLIDKALHPDQQKPLDMSVFEITDAQVQEQKEAAKKREIEEKEAKAKADAEAKSKKEEEGDDRQSIGQYDENGMEVVIEDDDEDDIFGDGGRNSNANSEEKSAFELLMEASLPPEQPQAEEDVVEEEDAMMLEEYQQFENFDEVSAHDDNDGTPEKGKQSERKKDEPSLSLLPSGNKKKKKQKFKTARSGRKKK